MISLLPDSGPAARRCLIMGVLNVTPDSFWDGGHYRYAEAAVAQGLKLIAEGADIVDVGYPLIFRGELNIVLSTFSANTVHFKATFYNKCIMLAYVSFL